MIQGLMEGAEYEMEISLYAYAWKYIFFFFYFFLLVQKKKTHVNFTMECFPKVWYIKGSLSVSRKTEYKFRKLKNGQDCA